MHYIQSCKNNKANKSLIYITPAQKKVQRHLTAKQTASWLHLRCTSRAHAEKRGQTRFFAALGAAINLRRRACNLCALRRAVHSIMYARAHCNAASSGCVCVCLKFRRELHEAAAPLLNLGGCGADLVLRSNPDVIMQNCKPLNLVALVYVRAPPQPSHRRLIIFPRRLSLVRIINTGIARWQVVLLQLGGKASLSARTIFQARRWVVSSGLPLDRF